MINSAAGVGLLLSLCEVQRGTSLFLFALFHLSLSQQLSPIHALVMRVMQHERRVTVLTTNTRNTDAL